MSRICRGRKRRSVKEARLGGRGDSGCRYSDEGLLRLGVPRNCSEVSASQGQSRLYSSRVCSLMLHLFPSLETKLLAGKRVHMSRLDEAKARGRDCICRPTMSSPRCRTDPASNVLACRQSSRISPPRPYRSGPSKPYRQMRR